MAAQLWRFDIYNGSTAANLVAGGVIASLGTHDDSAPHLGSRGTRLYNPPDVAAVTKRGTAPSSTLRSLGLPGTSAEYDVQDRFLRFETTTRSTS